MGGHVMLTQVTPSPWNVPRYVRQAANDTNSQPPLKQQAPGPGVVVDVVVEGPAVVVGTTEPQAYRRRSQSDSLAVGGYAGHGHVVGQGSSIFVQPPVPFPLNAQYLSQGWVVQHSQYGVPPGGVYVHVVSNTSQMLLGGVCGVAHRQHPPKSES